MIQPIDPARFINRELSWLAFNRRVLAQAENDAFPLLERLRFVAIAASNLEEFFMVREAALRGQKAMKPGALSQDGLTVDEQLFAIRRETSDLIASLRESAFRLLNELEKKGIKLLNVPASTAEEQAWLRQYFADQILPLLSPLTIAANRRFPFVPNRVLSIFCQLQPHGKADEKFETIITLPSMLPRFIRLPAPEGEARYVSLEQAILFCMDQLCPDAELLNSAFFRVLRDSEFEIDDDVDDIIETFRSALKRRRRGNVMRLIVTDDIAPDMLRNLAMQMGVERQDISKFPSIIGLSDLQKIIAPDRPDLLFTPFAARFPERIRDFDNDCFAAIRHKDIVVHHPYESFDVVAQFLRQAANDPDVVSIKQTLYRTSANSPIVEALIKAAEAGKSVTAMIELKARFDEEANLRWARDLELAGARVVFGFPDLKTHAKVSLVVRREADNLKSYVHFGTGNYHPQTAKIYTDLSFFSCDPALCRDAARIFNFMTSMLPPRALEKAALAPFTLRRQLLELIDQEIAFAKAGRPAQIWLKLNALLDADMIDALYRASQAGVKIDAVVRGICALRPGIKGLSDNIRVKSIVGRYLEHARIICFGAGHGLPSFEARVFLTSADWMPRNLDRRIEVMVPLENPTVHAQVLDQIMQANLADNVNSWILQPDGTYEQVRLEDQKPFSAHDYFMNNPSLSGRGSALTDETKPQSFL